MKTKILSVVAAVPLLAIATVGSAAEPMSLSENQMDSVTAGFSAFADALANAYGKFAFSDTFAYAEIGAIANSNLGTQAGTTLWGSLSTATSVSDASASVPTIFWDNGD